MHIQNSTTDIGSTLLYVMDRFALGPYDPEQGELEDTDNIGEHRASRWCLSTGGEILFAVSSYNAWKKHLIYTQTDIAKGYFVNNYYVITIESSSWPHF